jgi:hypothetical protein
LGFNSNSRWEFLSDFWQDNAGPETIFVAPLLSFSRERSLRCIKRSRADVANFLKSERAVKCRGKELFFIIDRSGCAVFGWQLSIIQQRRAYENES